MKIYIKPELMVAEMEAVETLMASSIDFPTGTDDEEVGAGDPIGSVKGHRSSFGEEW